MKKMENGCAPDALDIYKAFGDLAADTLFWKLIFLNSALFGTPNRQDVKQKLLSQSRAGEALIHTYYTLPAADRLIELADVHNRLFVIYVERSAARRPALRESTHRQWEENGRRIARLLPQLNPFWKQPEWNAMIAHQIQLLTTIAQGTLEGQYAVFTTTAPLCQRLAADMADYMAAGVIADPSFA